MSLSDYINISSDEETEVTNVEDVKPMLLSDVYQDNADIKIAITQPSLGEYCIKHREISHDLLKGVTNGPYLSERGSNPHDGLCPSSTSYGSFVTHCRQFWKSGDYEVKQAPSKESQSGRNRLRIHPKFLHSNATSHKWAFGAVAELLDNAIDEVQNGATFVIIDKFTNPRNGEAALLIHDDGGGMDPESLRHCMSFGFSDKQSDAYIGQYGNGFKTSTMRLGADVIVLSRCANQTVLTQSVGLLSYTFLRQTGCDDIVVPVVDYEFDPLTCNFGRLLRIDEKQFSHNLSTLLRWCPFASETELLEQFSDIGHHGTKVIVFNLWHNDDGDMELDFESDPKDILINKTKMSMQTIGNGNEQTRKHIANRLLYSLQVYSSILYLHVPEFFKIVLRNEVVVPHRIINDLIYRECVLYRPHVEGNPEVVTTIGFLEGAPKLSIHGFNVYHRNRLILPFWRVVSNTNGKGRGVVGVLEANFVKPTHDKQDFEKSSIYQKLETRLKDMTYEYWDLHSYLLGYKPTKFIPNMSPTHAPPLKTFHVKRQSKMTKGGFSIAETSQAQVMFDPEAQQQTVCTSQNQTGLMLKRKQEDHISAANSLKKKADDRNAAGLGGNHKAQQENSAKHKQKEEIKTMMLENKKLQQQCMEFEEREKDLLLEKENLTRELRSYQRLHEKLSADLNSLEDVKVEK